MFERIFSAESYRALLKMLLQTHGSLRFCDIPDRDKAGAYFLSRHDVDYSLEYAWEMAKIDHELGVKSTYFVLLTSPFYNAACGRQVRDIASLGHEIGLHYDIAEMESLSEGISLLENLDVQADFLGQLAGSPIRTIAVHNPSVTGQTRIPGQSKYIDAYDPEFFSPGIYVSDACVAWRDNGLALLKAPSRPQLMQLCTHPICWLALGDTRWQKLDAVFEGYQGDLNVAKSSMKSAWSQHQGVREHDARQNA